MSSNHFGNFFGRPKKFSYPPLQLNHLQFFPQHPVPVKCEDFHYYQALSSHKEHFLLHCSYFKEHRQNLLAAVNRVVEAYKYSDASDMKMLQLLLHGSKNLPSKASKLMLNLTIKYISDTKRFG